MEVLNFESYFENIDNKYYDARYIIEIFEDILGNSMDNIKKYINESLVVVTEEQIKEFLQKSFEEENSELKRRIENPKPKRSRNLGKLSQQDIEDASQEFIDSLSARRYHFEPYTLQYFSRYSTIVRNKANLLLDIIEKIGNKQSVCIQDLITELDIQLDENGNISKDDIIRLITPTVFNINELHEKITKANDLSTYLTFEISIDSLYKADCFESEIYPTKSLQIKNLFYDCIKGNVPLSNNQRIQLEEEQRRSINQFVKMMFE